MAKKTVSRKKAKKTKIVARSVSRRSNASFSPLRKTTWHNPMFLLVVLAVAFLGGYFLFKSFALTNTVTFSGSFNKRNQTASYNFTSTASGVISGSASYKNLKNFAMQISSNGQPVSVTYSGSNPLTFTTASVPAGSYTLQVSGAPLTKNTGSYSVSVSYPVADTTPPSVKVNTPASGSTISGTTPLTGSATDNTGVSKVEVAVDGSVYSAATLSGSNATSVTWSYSLDTTALSNASHTVQVRATDLVGNTGTTSATYTVNNSSTTGGGTGGGSSTLLYSPPAMTNPVTYHVSGVPSSISIPSTQDAYIKWDAPTTRRLQISGGHNIQIIGGEVNNDNLGATGDDNAGLEFSNVTGTIYIEGLWITGHGVDGIRLASGSAQTTLIVQKTRIDGRYGSNTTDTRLHADCIQPFGGVKLFETDHYTCNSQFQGQMFKTESSSANFGNTFFNNTNFANQPGVSATGFLINFVSGTETITLNNVYVLPQGTFCTGFQGSQTSCQTDSATGKQYIVYTGTSLVVKGFFWQGPPPNGDYVPASTVGMTYVP